MATPAPRSRWLSLLVISSMLVATGLGCHSSDDGQDTWMSDRQME